MIMMVWGAGYSPFPVPGGNGRMMDGREGADSGCCRLQPWEAGGERADIVLWRPVRSHACGRLSRRPTVHSAERSAVRLSRSLLL